ncbi:galactokinase [bacterium]|nr:galactokinase [bacterium]
MRDPTQLPDNLSRLFSDHFDRTLDEAVVVRSPGRMNLLGEHTDYNGGFVLPIAIDRSTWVVAAPAEGQVRVWSEARGELDVFTPGQIHRDEGRLWANYVRAVAWALEEQFGPVPGADVLITGDLPLGSGVSSSASLEVGAALAFLGVAQREMPLRDVALMCQRAENQFVGVQCGIMDQFAVALCEAGHALLLDCLSLETQNVALAGDAPVFFVCDTAKERTLAASAYNQRRAECESAARHFGHESLRHVTPEQLEAGKGELPEHVYRRCRHVLSENARVHEAIAVMGCGAWERFGELLQASHASLRDDYEVSCDELNIMCELAMEHDGCLGARMVGAGFGGCAMAAVRREAVSGFAETVGAAYQPRTGLQPRLFAVQAAGGAAILPH